MNCRVPFRASLLLLAAVFPSAGQVQLGEFNLNGNALLSAGYTGDYGNQTGSDHGVTLGGAGTFNGSFYNPGFLSFSVMPFLNQSREDSTYQSLTNASGVNASTTVFGGSSFPGTISFSKVLNAEGNYNVPGVANFTSRGDSQVLDVNWSENVPSLPHVSISFLDGGSDYSLYGASGDLNSDFRSLQVQTLYHVAGFSLTGNYLNSDTSSKMPDILGSGPETTDTDTNTVSFGIGHALPFHGSFSAGIGRSDVTSDSSEGDYNATLDSLGSSLNFAPVRNLNFGATFSYVDNLAASLDDTIIAAGGTVSSTPQYSSHSMDLVSFVNYQVPAAHLTFSASDDRRDQAYSGEYFQSNSYTGSLSYANAFLGGFLNATGALTRTTVSTDTQAIMGWSGTVNYTRQMGKWTASGMIHYGANVETALIAYTSTGYGYSANVGRQFSRATHWSLSGSGSKSTVSNEPGAGTYSQNYTSTLALRRISFSGSYSRSDGNSILTATGLQPITVPVAVVEPSSVILYGGHAYSGSIGLYPVRGLTITGTYTQAFTNTQGDSIDTDNRMVQLNAYMQYQVRKLYFTAGFAKLTQSFSSSGNVPAMTGTFYFGISRWFSFL